MFLVYIFVWGNCKWLSSSRSNFVPRRFPTAIFIYLASAEIINPAIWIHVFPNLRSIHNNPPPPGKKTPRLLCWSMKCSTISDKSFIICQRNKNIMFFWKVVVELLVRATLLSAAESSEGIHEKYTRFFVFFPFIFRHHLILNMIYDRGHDWYVELCN